MCAQEAAAAALEAARADAARCAKYLARLREVQARRAGMEAALAGNPDADPDPDPDPDGGASEASSAVSGLSAYTFHSFHTGRGAGRDPAGVPARGSAASSRASPPPSTVGGRRARRDRKPARAGRIRQGGAGEVRRINSDAPHCSCVPGDCVSKGTELLLLQCLMNGEPAWGARCAECHSSPPRFQ